MRLIKIREEVSNIEDYINVLKRDYEKIITLARAVIEADYGEPREQAIKALEEFLR